MLKVVISLSGQIIQANKTKTEEIYNEDNRTQQAKEQNSIVRGFKSLMATTAGVTDRMDFHTTLFI